MAEEISFYSNDKLLKLNLEKLKSGISKRDLKIEEGTVLATIFDSINADKSEGSETKLNRAELIKFFEKIKELCGDDKELSSNEARKYELGEQKLGKNKDELLKFLSKLSEFTKGIKEVKQSAKSEIIVYDDGHTEEVYKDGSKTITVNEGNKLIVTKKDAQDNILSEKVAENGVEVLTEFEKGLKAKETKTTVDGTEVIAYKNGNPTTKTITNKSGDVEIYAWEKDKFVLKEKTNKSNNENVVYKNGQEIITSEENGVSTRIIKENGRVLSKTTIKRNEDGKEEKNVTTYDEENSLEELFVDGIKRSQKKVINGKEYVVRYDDQGNTLGVIVQNNESISAIAKKFNCDIRKLIEVNASNVKGKYPNVYFIVGTEIKIPRTLEAEDPALQGRKSIEEAVNDYKQKQEEIAKKRRADEARRAEEARQAEEDRQAEEARQAKKNQIKEKLIQYESARLIVEDLKKAIKGVNSNKAIKEALARIDNPVEYEEVERLLEVAGYKADDLYSAIEKFMYKELSDKKLADNSFEYLENTVQEWIANGTIKGEDAIKAQARLAARVIFDAGDGFGTDPDETKRGIYLIKGVSNEDPVSAKKVLDEVNNIVKKHRTFYGITGASDNLFDYLKGELWQREIKYLKGILAQNDAITGSEKSQSIKDLIEKAIKGGGTNVEYLKQAFKAIKTPEERKEVETLLAEYCKKRGIEYQYEGQSPLQAIMYDECDTFLGISRNFKEIRKFNEMMIAQGAYSQEEIVALRAEQAYLQTLEGNYSDILEAVENIEDKKVLAKFEQLIASKGYVDFEDFLNKEVLDYIDRNLIKADLASKNLLPNLTAAIVAARLITQSDFDIRAKGFAAIRNEEVARQVDKFLAIKNTSLAETFEEFNKDKAKYKRIARLWDGFSTVIAEIISEKSRKNTDVSDNMYVEAKTPVELNLKQLAIYQMTVETFEENLKQMKEDYENCLDSQGALSYAVNKFAEVYNIGTTRDEIEARIEHDTETLRLLKLAANGKLTKYVAGKTVPVSFEEVFTERQSAEIKANGGTALAIRKNKGAEAIEFSSEKVEKVSKKAETLGAMDQVNTIVLTAWRDLEKTDDLSGLTIGICNTLKTLSELRGEELSLANFGCSLDNWGHIYNSDGKLASLEQLQEIANKLKQGLMEITKELYGKDMPISSKTKDIKEFLEDSYSEKLENFKKEYEEAFGQKAPDAVVEKYIKTINTGKTIVNFAAIIGAAIAAPFTGGGSLAVFAAVGATSMGLNALEKSTDSDGYTNSEWTTDLEQALWDGALTAVGMKIGKYAEAFAQGSATSSELYRKILEKNANLLSKIFKNPNDLQKATDILTRIEAGGYKVTAASAQKLNPKNAQLVAKFIKNPANYEKAMIWVGRFEAAGVEISSDALQSYLQMYCQYGEFDEASFISGILMSVGGNLIGHTVGALGDVSAVEPTNTYAKPNKELENLNAYYKNLEDNVNFKNNPTDVVNVEVFEKPVEKNILGDKLMLKKIETLNNGEKILYVDDNNGSYIKLNDKGQPVLAVDKSDNSTQIFEYKSNTDTMFSKSITKNSNGEITEMSEVGSDSITTYDYVKGKKYLCDKNWALKNTTYLTLDEYTKVLNPKAYVDNMLERIDEAKDANELKALLVEYENFVKEYNYYDNSDLIIKHYNAKENTLPKVASQAKITSAMLDSAKISQYGKKGLTLTYSGTDLAKDIRKCLSELKPSELAQITDDFNINFIKDEYGNYVLQDIPNLSMTAKTEAHQKILDLLNKYTKQNSFDIEPAALKTEIEKFVEKVPEFMFMVGKPQNGKHFGSLDVHTFAVLEKALKYADEANLTSNQKEILTMSIMLHDMGKKYKGAFTSDTGHEVLSTQYAKQILDRFDYSQEVKNKILNLVENHHWFKHYNKGTITADAVSTMFGEDLGIAKVFAKADLESVNDTFHKDVLNATSDTDYQAKIKQKLDGITNDYDLTNTFEKLFAPKEALELPLGEMKVSDDITHEYLTYKLDFSKVDKIKIGNVEIDFNDAELKKLMSELKDGESFAIGCTNPKIKYPDVKYQIGKYEDGIASHHLVITKQGDGFVISPHHPATVIKDYPTKPSADPSIAKKIQQIKSYGTTSVSETLNIGGKEVPFEILQGYSQGSNGGYYAINKLTGDLYFIKEGVSTKSEIAAAKIYELAGIDVPEISYFSTADGKVGMISKFIPDLVPVTGPNAAANEAFGMNVLLANWDAVISDNTCITKDGKALLIDCGGTLDHHAHQASLKPFTSIPTEFLSLLDGKHNPGAKSVYSLMTREDLIKSLRKAVDLDADAVKQTLSDMGLSHYAQIILERQKFLKLLLEKIENAPLKGAMTYEYLEDAMVSALKTHINEAKTLGQLQDAEQALGFLSANNKKKLQIIIVGKKTLKSVLQSKGTKLSESELISHLGLQKTDTGYSFKVTQELEDYLIKYFGHSQATTVLKKIQKILTKSDIDNIRRMLNEASPLCDVLSVEPYRILLMYANIIEGQSDVFKSNKMTAKQWAVLLNVAKEKMITAPQISAFAKFKGSSTTINISLTTLKVVENIIKAKSKGIELPSNVLAQIDVVLKYGKYEVDNKILDILSRIKSGEDVSIPEIQKITSYLNPAILDQIAHIESYISTQVIPEDLSLYRVEGYYGGGNSYGCLGSITLTNGKTLDVALEEAVAGGEDAIKAMEKSISMGELDLETGKFKKYVAVNERFTSTRLLKSGNGSAGSGKVVWEFNIKKGSKAVFMEGNNITGSLSGECEVILQKDSQFIITDIKYDKNIKKWVVKADVVN